MAQLTPVARDTFAREAFAVIGHMQACDDNHVKIRSVTARVNKRIFNGADEAETLQYLAMAQSATKRARERQQAGETGLSCEEARRRFAALDASLVAAEP